jgi:hypothetical protein
VNFVHPSFLWAFAGLAIPLAIHLLSRKEGKVIRVGSLRHVEESNTSQFKSIRLNEILLLLLRCLMIAAIVLLLSGTRCTSDSPGARAKWVVVEPGIDTHADYKSQIDSLLSDGYELHFLSPGFPKVATSDAITNYWKLSEELGQLSVDAVVITWSDATKYKGQRTTLPGNTRWISAAHEQVDFVGGAWKTGDSTLVRMGKSDPFGTAYQSLRGIAVEDSITIENPEKINVSITGDSDDANEIRILTAAINVIKKEYRLPIQIASGEDPIPDGSKWLFWLREAQPKLASDQQVVFSRPGTGPLIERVSSNVLHLNRKLDQDVALNENLVINLLKTFYPDGNIAATAKSKEVNSLPEEFAWSQQPTDVALSAAPAAKALDAYLVLFFFLLLGTERFVAIQRNQ